MGIPSPRLFATLNQLRRHADGDRTGLSLENSRRVSDRGRVPVPACLGNNSVVNTDCVGFSRGFGQEALPKSTMSHTSAERIKRPPTPLDGCRRAGVYSKL